MTAAKKSSTRKAASSQRKGTARRQPFLRKPAGPRAQTSANAPVPARYLHLKLHRSRQGAEARARVKIPPILLEGDTPGTPSPSPAPPAPEPAIEPTGVASGAATLPEAYGTQQLKLTPRDPHWIHAHWDFTPEQLEAARAQSAQGHLVLRLFERSPKGPLVSETNVLPNSVRWLVHAPQPTTPYTAEIGYYNKQHRWSALAVAEPVRTPPAGPSSDLGFERATLTHEGTLQRHGSLKTLSPPESLPVQGPALDSADWSSAEAQRPGPPGLEAGLPGMASPPSSLDVSSWSSAGMVSSISSPGVAAPQPPFRLEVNAELILYGATEPDAVLHIGDRTVPLNADGSFRFRFALPDGTYRLPVQVTSAETGEQRTAELEFARHTETRGKVEAAPRASGLKPPGAENL